MTDISKLANRARAIARTLGFRSAAGFLRNREIKFEDAHWLLFGYAPRASQ